MKYIRTKDEIIDLSKITISKDGWKSIEEYITFKQDDQQEPIKQANTIEELVERYVVILEHQDKPLIVFKGEIENYKYCFVNKVKSNNRVLAIYGSIWVGLDLVSKAKMNDKGELELL